MAFFEWQDRFDLKIHSMNNEHKQIIYLMNELHEAHTRQASKREIAKVLEELFSYTIQHFKDEEAYMLSVNFPGYETHKIIHEQLLKQLTTHKVVFENSESGLSQEFFDFLSVWLSSHIAHIDMQYSHHALTKKVS